MARIVGQGNMPRKQKAIRLDNTNNTRIWETKKMTIDELQERFNELRGKKLVTVDSGSEVVFTGFDIGGYGPQLFVEIRDKTFVTTCGGIDPITLAKRFGKNPIIKEIDPYKDWPIDAKALFWNTGEKKCKGHFAGVNSFGKPLRFISGMTSFTNDMCELAIYDHAELAED